MESVRPKQLEPNGKELQAELPRHIGHNASPLIALTGLFDCLTGDGSVCACPQPAHDVPNDGEMLACGGCLFCWRAEDLPVMLPFKLVLALLGSWGLGRVPHGPPDPARTVHSISACFMIECGRMFVSVCGGAPFLTNEPFAS
jgi:hypothetical protein